MYQTHHKSCSASLLIKLFSYAPLGAPLTHVYVPVYLNSLTALLKLLIFAFAVISANGNKNCLRVPLYLTPQINGKKCANL